jgi:hypothetical protein
MNATLGLGLIGLSITVALNVFGVLVLRQAAARVFTDNWWSVVVHVVHRLVRYRHIASGAAQPSRRAGISHTPEQMVRLTLSDGICFFILSAPPIIARLFRVYRRVSCVRSEHGQAG